MPQPPSNLKRIRAGEAFMEKIKDDPVELAKVARVSAKWEAFGAAVALIQSQFGKFINPWDMNLLMPDSTLRLFGEQIAQIQREQNDKYLAEVKSILAKAKVAEQQYDAEWLSKTGEVPPRWKTVEELEFVAIPWWQEKAALAGIAPDKILSAGERVQELAPIIKGRLQLMKIEREIAAAGIQDRSRRRSKTAATKRSRKGATKADPPRKAASVKKAAASKQQVVAVKRNAGRKPLWDDLYILYQQLKADDETITDKSVVDAYNRQFSRREKKATVGALRQARYERTKRNRRRDNENRSGK